MKNLLLLYLVVLCLCSCKSTPVNNSPSYAHFGYNKIGLFVYSCNIYDSTNRCLSTDTLALFCTGRIMEDMDSHTFMQWKTIGLANGQYIVKGYSNGYDFTGLMLDDTLLYIHPPRYGKYKVLEFCPFPLIQSRQSIWKWDLDIGEQWAIDSIYPIKYGATFYNIYTKRGEVEIETNNGKLRCLHVAASSTSIFGQAFSNFYINDQLGLVRFDMQPINKMKHEFTFMNKITSYDSFKFDPEFR